MGTATIPGELRPTEPRAAEPRKIRVCVLTEYFNPSGVGGTPSVIPELCRHIRLRHPQCELSVLTSRNVYRADAERLPRHEMWEGIPVRRIGTPKSNQASTGRRLLAGMAFAAAALAHLLCGARYDVVFVGTNPPPGVSAALLLKRLRGTPYVYLIHDLFPDIAITLGAIPPGGRVARVCRGLQRKWLTEASRVIPIGRCMRDHLKATYGVPEERMEVVPNWADPEGIQPGPKQNAFRAQHGLGGFVALYAGNFGQYQDLDTLLDAATLLRTQCPEATLALVGNGVREEHVRGRIADEGISNVSVIPLVFQSEYPGVLAAADACLVTLNVESVGLGVPSKFYGILASGRPIIAVVPAGSEIARVIEEERCGYRVDPGDPAALASAVGHLQSSPDEALEMGRRARSALERRFTVTTAAAAFARVFEEVAITQGPTR